MPHRTRILHAPGRGQGAVARESRARMPPGTSAGAKPPGQRRTGDPGAGSLLPAGLQQFFHRLIDVLLGEGAAGHEQLVKLAVAVE